MSEPAFVSNADGSGGFQTRRRHITSFYAIASMWYSQKVAWRRAWNEFGKRIRTRHMCRSDSRPAGLAVGYVPVNSTRDVWKIKLVCAGGNGDGQ